jgi:hypothetical protein
MAAQQAWSAGTDTRIRGTDTKAASAKSYDLHVART